MAYHTVRRISPRRICGATLGVTTLLLLYSQTTQIGTDCPYWAGCQDNAGLREVRDLPDVRPDKCVNTATMYQGTRTIICIKPVSVDKFVSGAILSSGAWEKNIVNLVLRAMELYKTAVFLDIGANIGIYTVLVAAAKRQVVAVDAMLENLAYITHSLNISGTSDYVRLLGNPVSDKVDTMFPVTDNKDNQGGTRLVPASLISKDSNKIAGLAVNTTTLLDVLKFINSNTVIVKMDVEGFECKVLQPYLLNHHQSSSIFLPYIIMEWMHIKVNLDSNCPDLKGLVELLYNSGYKPYDLYKEKLIDRETTDWLSYTDILWAHTEAAQLL